jgi:penicillin amidase
MTAPEDPARDAGPQGKCRLRRLCRWLQQLGHRRQPHTASGKPLLSNDMHLTLREPDTWYMADSARPVSTSAGVTLPGMPFIVAGHNEHVAWGYTALLADVQDLYYEEARRQGQLSGA